MHTGNMGVLKYFLGSVLYVIMHSGRFRGSIEKRCDEFYDHHLTPMYAKLLDPARIGKLTPGMFIVKDNFPVFSGKAAETQHLLYALKEYWLEARDGGDHDEHIMRALGCL
eukprot:4433675-Pyramimonas_sp.AAC.1